MDSNTIKIGDNLELMTINIPEWAVMSLNEASDDTGFSRQAIIRTAIYNHLNNMGYGFETFKKKLAAKEAKENK